MNREMNMDNRDARPVDGQVLLNQLNSLAPLTTKSEEELKKEGWEEFYSYYEFSSNGAANTEHLQLALAEINGSSPVSGDYEICRAYPSNISDESSRQRVRILYKRKTQQRLDWERKDLK
jgi:hypothetical protein